MEGRVPPARSQENWAHQGQAPVGTLRRTCIRNTTICLLCLCPGTMLQHFQHFTAKFDIPKTSNCFTGMDELLGALWDGPQASNAPHAIPSSNHVLHPKPTRLQPQTMCFHPQPTCFHPQRGKTRRNRPCLGEQEPRRSHSPSPPSRTPPPQAREPLHSPWHCPHPTLCSGTHAACILKGKPSQEMLVDGHQDFSSWLAHPANPQHLNQRHPRPPS